MLTSLKAYDVVYQALQRCGAISYGDPIEPGLGRSALIELNALLAEWCGRYIYNDKFDYSIDVGETLDKITLGTEGFDPTIYSNGTGFFSDPTFLNEVFPDKYHKYEAVIDRAVTKVRVNGLIPIRPAAVTDITVKYGNVNITIFGVTLNIHGDVNITIYHCEIW